MATVPQVESRENALKAALSNAGIVLPAEETQAVADRYAEWESSLKPWSVFETWCTEQVVTLSIQVENCQHKERVHRIGLAERAATGWNEDRRLAAALLGENISKRPETVVLQLRQTPQGCDWLIGRWQGLGQVLEAKGVWTAPQRALALDLLGTPAELRDGASRLDADPAACVAAMIAELTEFKRTVAEDRDAHEQAAARLGLGSDVAPPLAKLRRHEVECRRRLAWALAELQRNRRARVRPDQAVPANPYANVSAPRVPQPQPTPTPRFDDWDGALEPASDRIEPFSANPPTAFSRR